MTELRPFQIEGVQQIYDFHGRAILADEQGLGKTIQALDWIRRIKKCRPAVIVTPAALKWTWEAEAFLHFGMRLTVLEGKRPGGHIDGDIIVVNYEILEAWLEALLRLRPQCVILDEAHYVKNASAQRTQGCFRLTEKARSVVALSGTPMTNYPVDLWSILHMVKPNLFPSFTEYAWRYCSPRHTRYGWVYTGSANRPELKRILREHVMIRRTKKEVATEIPDKIHHTITFQLPPAQLRKYRHAKNNFIGWLRERDPAAAATAKKNKALLKVGYLLRYAAELKRPFIEQWLRDFQESHPGKKLVGLSMNRPTMDFLCERFPHHVRLDGMVTGRLRSESVRKFQTNPRTVFAFGNWKAAGVGITLHASHNFAALDFPWDPGTLWQGIDRIHRIGQKEICNIYWLVARDTLEEKLITILRKKTNIISAIMDTAEQKDEDLLSIFQELVKEANSDD